MGETLRISFPQAALLDCAGREQLRDSLLGRANAFTRQHVNLARFAAWYEEDFHVSDACLPPEQGSSDNEPRADGLQQFTEFSSHTDCDLARKTRLLFRHRIGTGVVQHEGPKSRIPADVVAEAIGEEAKIALGGLDGHFEATRDRGAVERTAGTELVGDPNNAFKTWVANGNTGILAFR